MPSETLPDGSEKGLSGYNHERMPRTRIGLAPAAGEIDRNRPTWPYRQDTPVHYAHPVVAKALAGKR